ncbi:MAG: hypothetical protein FJY75_06005 [Candidatus Eisenbacteria bacterium]|uniref:PilN domain-containing protein n=1 Tax=Eiseniibacteriota bacterium TaxID=2212470 RepID=A0A938BNM9_UNCEI|nr:hypothetical protein [Candidatus Eisenbacteria bacterium]
MGGVNLIPPDLLERREARRLSRAWIGRLGVTLALLGVLFAALGRLAARQIEEVDRAAASYAALTARLQSAEELLRLRDRLAERHDMIGFIRGEMTADQLLEALAASLAPDTYLTCLSLERCPPAEAEAAPAPGAAPCESSLMLRGLAPGHRDVGEVLRRLGAQPVFRGVTLVSVQGPAAEQRAGELEFEMLCRLAGETPDD